MGNKWLYAILFAILTLVVSCTKDNENTQPVVTPETQSTPTNVRTLRTAPLLPDVQISSVTLFAGKTINAGTVSIYQTDTNHDFVYDAFNVVYTLIDGWQFASGDAVKFYLGATKPTDDTPGLFANHYAPGEGAISYTVTFPFTTFGFECTPVTLYIAAHADLQKPNGDGTYQTETGWGNGTKFNEKGSWSMYYSFDLTDKTPPTAPNVTLNVECIGDVPAQTTDVIIASDNCALAGTPVTFVSEVNDGQFCPTTITRSYLITDAAGNTSSAKQTITVYDKTKPVLSGQGENVLLACASEVIFTDPKATDNCDLALVTITKKDTQTTDANGKVLSMTRTWTATDACGNESLPVSQTFTLDVVSPVISLNGPAYQSIACDAVLTFAVPTATDNYDTNPTITAVVPDVIDNTTIPNTIITTRTWVATDKCGNTSTVSQTIERNCSPVTPPPGDFPAGAGTAWAYLDNDASIPFNSLSPKIGNNWGWTNLVKGGTTSMRYTLYVGAGQNIITKGIAVGIVDVTVNGGTINFKYTVSSLCNISGIHVWVGKTYLPMNKQKSYISAPGQLGYNSGLITGNTASFSIPFTAGTSDFYIAAHSDIVLK